MMKKNFPTDSLYKTIKLSDDYNKVIDLNNLLPGPEGQHPLCKPGSLCQGSDARYSRIEEYWASDCNRHSLGATAYLELRFARLIERRDCYAMEVAQDVRGFINWKYA